MVRLISLEKTKNIEVSNVAQFMYNQKLPVFHFMRR
jgi:hypothetical protein